MSQMPTTEPQAVEGASPAGAGTSGAQVQTNPELEQAKQENAKLQAEVERLKPLEGWQKEFTKLKQAGLYDMALQTVGTTGNPQTLKSELESLKQAKAVLDQYGGPDRLRDMREAWEILNPPAVPAADAATPYTATPAVPGQPQVNLDEHIQAALRDILPKAVQSYVSARDMATATDLAAANLAKESGQTDPDASYRFRALLDAELARMTTDAYGNRRDAMPDDVARAAQMVNDAFITPLRAAGIVSGQPTPTNQVPPTVNARGPGGQQPGRPLSEMSRDEINAAIAAQAGQAFGDAAAAQPGVNQPQWPSNWSSRG